MNIPFFLGAWKCSSIHGGTPAAYQLYDPSAAVVPLCMDRIVYPSTFLFIFIDFINIIQQIGIMNTVIFY